jgi:hypothetical protein
MIIMIDMCILQGGREELRFRKTQTTSFEVRKKLEMNMMNMPCRQIAARNNRDNVQPETAEQNDEQVKKRKKIIGRREISANRCTKSAAIPPSDVWLRKFFEINVSTENS